MEDEIKTTPGISKLQAWFSEPRMARYAAADNPAALYVWNERLSKAYLEEISYVEVLLRNFIAPRLAADCGRATGDPRWFDHPERYNLNEEFKKSVRKAKSRLKREGKDDGYDRVIAALTLDVWRYLLVSRLEPTVWRALRARENGGMPNYPGTSRADFEAHVAEFYGLRNRCSHHEHLVLDSADDEAARLDSCSEALRWTAEKIDPEAAAWIGSVSRVSEIRARRPASTEAGPDDAPSDSEARDNGL